MYYESIETSFWEEVEVEMEEAAVKVVELSSQAFPMAELLGGWELHQPPEAPR